MKINITEQELTNIRKDLVENYNTIMVQTYKKWYKTCDADILRLLFLDVISNHITSKSIEVIQRKTDPNKKLDKILKLLEEKTLGSEGEKWLEKE